MTCTKQAGVWIEMTSQILRNISWLMVGNVLVKPIWFVFITYVCIRFIGLEEYGSMTATLGLIAILDGMLTLGTSDYTVREVARDRSLSTQYFSNFLPFRVVASITAVGIGLLIEAIIGNQDLLVTTLFAGTYVFVRNLTEFCRSFFRAHETFKYEAFSTMWEKILVVTGGTVFLIQIPTAASALAGMTVGMIITLGINYAWVIKRFAQMKWANLKASFFRHAMPKAIPLGAAGIFVLLFFRTDSVMIEAFKGELVTGQYAIAFRVVEALLMLPAMVTAVILPRLSDYFQQSHAGFNRLGTRSIWGILATGLAIAAVIALFSPWIVTSMDSSPEAVPAIALMRVLVWLFPIASVNSVLSTLLVAGDRQNRLAQMLAAAAAVNIVLNLMLIPPYAAMGAAFATLATQIFVTVALSASLPFQRASIA